MRAASQYRLVRPETLPIVTGSIDVMIPAYNEALNIEACVRSVLNSTTLPSTQLSVWVVDDQSTDGTWEILRGLAGDDRLKILRGAIGLRAK